MVHNVLKILHITDENIKYVSADMDAIVNGKESTVVNAILTYTPKVCPRCGIKNEGQIQKNGKRITRIQLLPIQGYDTYLDLAKQRFKCLACNSTFTAETDVGK